MGLGRNMRKLLSVIVFACALFLFGAAEVTPVSAAFVCEHEIVTVPERAPTCTQAGMTQQSYCNLCDEVFSYGEPIAALGHNIVKETVLPTCTEEGYDWEHCTRCGEIDKRTNATEALGHTEEVIASVAATCTQAGFTAGKRCGKLRRLGTITGIGLSLLRLARLRGNGEERARAAGQRSGRRFPQRGTVGAIGKFSRRLPVRKAENDLAYARCAEKNARKKYLLRNIKALSEKDFGRIPPYPCARARLGRVDGAPRSYLRAEGAARSGLSAGELRLFRRTGNGVRSSFNGASSRVARGVRKRGTYGRFALRGMRANFYRAGGDRAYRTCLGGLAGYRYARLQRDGQTRAELFRLRKDADGRDRKAGRLRRRIFARGGSVESRAPIGEDGIYEKSARFIRARGA